MKSRPGAANNMVCVIGSLYTRILEDWAVGHAQPGPVDDGDAGQGDDERHRRGERVDDAADLRRDRWGHGHRRHR